MPEGRAGAHRTPSAGHIVARSVGTAARSTQEAAAEDVLGGRCCVMWAPLIRGGCQLWVPLLSSS
ncbi:hypothetical protein SB749_03630 [Brevibacterium sp. SIMBA_078]|uniref:hypothetical protein n=1 Tax=Brevibacterium sp. SIMBA_078 TaxID=3085816 RepID=UPI003977EC69